MKCRCLGIVAALCAAVIVSGCCRGGSKSKTSTTFQQLEGGMSVPGASDGLSHEALLQRLRGKSGEASSPAEAGESIEVLKAKLKAAEDALATADLKAKLRAAQDRIAELESAAAEPATAETDAAPEEADPAPAENENETPEDDG